jgi:hypothetical protein
MRNLVFSAIVLAFACADLQAATASIDSASIDAMKKLPVGGTFVVAGLADGTGARSDVKFRRVDVYAPDARIVVVDASGEHEIPRSRRIELIGADASNRVHAALGVDPDTGGIRGVGTTSAGTFVVTSKPTKNGVALTSVPIESTYPEGVVPRIESGDDARPSGRPEPSAIEIALASVSQPSASVRTGVVAVDTDNELMSLRFSNNTATATSWIADLFATMNVMYNRDLNVNLLQGTTKLRTTTDPYSQNDTPADNADLDEFGNYWAANYGNVPRAFAILLSGKASSGNSASGIAWIDAYCQTQSQGGSYSVNQVFTNPQIGVGLSALIVGHELGHNFGAYHTHCTNIATGAAPTGTNTIDQCVNFEAGSGCYSGPTGCPNSGPGAPAGTLMSYCNIAGCGPTGQNVLQFHPTQIAVLNAYITANTPMCLTSGAADPIFKNGFD